MGISNNYILDIEGNKHYNLNESSTIDETQIGRNISNFEVLQILSGETTPFLVIKARSLFNKKIYSIKEYPIGSNSIQLKQTFEILKKLNHPHILKYYDYFEENNKYYLIMEYINNSDIKGFIQAHGNLNKPIPEIEIWNILLQCLSALEYINDMNNNYNINLKLIDVFMTNEQRIKIGVFNDLKCNNRINSEKQNFFFLYDICYKMINPQLMNDDNIKNNIINNNCYSINIDQNFVYSNELKNIIYNMLDISQNSTQIVISNAYNFVKNEYVKKYNKITSIKAILENLFLYKYLNKKILKQKDSLLAEKKKYYINYLYLNTIDALSNNNDQTIFDCVKEFKREIALDYSKLVRDRELDPLLILTYILEKMHEEFSGINKDTMSKSRNEEDSSVILNSGFNGGEEDRTNERQMLDKFINSSLKNSFISGSFISIVKTERQCQTCRTKYYNFSNCLYIIFDLSNRNSNSNFDLIKDGFEAQKNEKKVICSDENETILCERCLTETQFEESKSYYLLNRHLIICFIRGKNYINRSQIIFQKNINLKQYIETADNSSHNFYLLGSVNRLLDNNGEKFISRKPENYYGQNLQLNEQIIMLFYNSNDKTN